MIASGSTPESVQAAALARLIVFRLVDRDYALPVEDIVEVLRMVELTPVPEAPGWMAGVMDLRGRVTPVVDLRSRLGLPYQEPGLATPILVAARGERVIGLIADEVIEMLSLSQDAVESPDDVTAARPISAVARADDRLIMLLDLELLFSDSEGLVSTQHGAD